MIRVVLVALLAVPAHAEDNFAWPPDVAAIGRGVNSPYVTTRIRAVQQLAELDIRLTLPYLTLALQDQEKRVREAAANTISGRYNAAVAPVIVSWLQSPIADMRVLALQTLGQARDESALKRIARLTTDSDPAVREAAVTALGAIGGDAVVQAIIARLRDDKSTVREAAANALSQSRHPDALLPLLSLLRDSSRRVQVAAIKALGDLRDPRAVMPIARLVSDPLSSVRAAAIEASGRIGDARAINALKSHATKRSTLTQEAASAYLALAQIARGAKDNRTKRRALDIVVEKLADAGSWSRAEIAIDVAEEAAVPSLLAGLRGEINTDVNRTVTALSKVRAPGATDLLIAELDRGRLPPSRILKALGSTGTQQAYEALLAELSPNNHPPRVAAAAGALRAFIKPGVNAAPFLLPLMTKGQNQDLLADVLDYITIIKPPAARKPLVQLLKDRKLTKANKQKALRALGLIGSGNDVTPILDHLFVQRSHAAARAISRIAPPKQAFAKAVARAVDPEHQQLLLRAAWGSAREKRTPEFCKRWQKAKDRRVRIAAIRCLHAAGEKLSGLSEIDIALATADYSDRTKEQLIDALRRRSEIVSATAAWALSRHNDNASEGALVKAMLSPRRLVAINASAALAVRGRVPERAYKMALRRNVPAVRSNVLIARARMGKLTDQELSAFAKRENSALGQLTALRLMNERADLKKTELYRELTGGLSTDLAKVARKNLAKKPGTEWKEIHVKSAAGSMQWASFLVTRSDGISRVYLSDALGELVDESFPKGDFQLWKVLRRHRDSQLWL